MLGDKARAIAQWGARAGLCVARFDYSGFGESHGAWDAATFGGWIADALAVLDSLPPGPVLLAGSSMGAWVAVRAALARPGRVAGLLTVAAAPDFTHTLLPLRFAQAGGGDLMAHLHQHGVLEVPSQYGDGPYRLTRHFITESASHRVLTGAPLTFAGPVRLLHGSADTDVPWSLSVQLMEALAGADCRLTLVKGGNHRLSTPADLTLLTHTLQELIELIRSQGSGG